MTKKKKHIEDYAFDTVHESELTGFEYIPGSNKMFMISKDGDIASRVHNCLSQWPGWWIRKKTRSSRSYQPVNQVLITLDGKLVHSTLGRLMLLTFVGPPPSPRHVAAHRNGKSDDDRLENLMWALPEDVSVGRIERGTYCRGEKAYQQGRFSKDQVKVIRELAADGVSQNKLARVLGCPAVRISELLSGRRWRPDKHIGRVSKLTGNTIEQETVK